MGVVIERNRRPAYATKRALLDDRHRLALDLIEEGIITDQGGSYRRREGPDGTTIDLSGYDEFGLAVAFRCLADPRIRGAFTVSE